MSKPRQLLKSIVPRVDESIQSIAMRLAPCALVTAAELLRYELNHAAGLASLPTDKNAVLRLGELGGFDPTEMMSRAILPGHLGYLVFEREVPEDWVSFAVRRLAPGVLREDGDTPYHRLSWQLTALDCDVATGEALVHRCPQCGVLLSWSRIRAIVDCGCCKFDLRHAASRYVPPDRLPLARRLYQFILRSGPPLPQPFDRLDDVTACYAMEWLAYFRNSGQSGKSLRPSAQNAVFGLEALYSWPVSFDSALFELEDFSGYGFGKKCASLVEKVDRAGSAVLRNVLLARAAYTLNAPTLCDADQQPLS
jgi:hypothetical protein